jgi:agmatinase
MDLVKEKKIPVFVGGEHTLTLGSFQGITGKTAILCFDAHLDLRNKYMGRTISHATVMRRLTERIDPEHILLVGTRATCREELKYAKKLKLNFLTMRQVAKSTPEKTIEEINEFLIDYKQIYLTIDMDVLDPAFAPAVQNPEPDGFTTNMLLNILCEVCDRRVTAFDLVEVTPIYDKGITAIQGAKIIFETLCYIDRSRNLETHN